MTTQQKKDPTTTSALTARSKDNDALQCLSNRLGVERSSFYNTLKETVFKGASESELRTLIVVANAYNLNPLTRELYAFPAKGGGIVPVVSIDGWCRIINNSKLLDGFEFEWEWTNKEKGIPFSCTCIMYVKGRNHPTKITELFSECKRNSEPWNNMATRMLRHKALIQAARYAFGFAGIYDEDEARDIVGSVEASGAPLPPPEIPPMEIAGEVVEGDDEPPMNYPDPEPEQKEESKPIAKQETSKPPSHDPVYQPPTTSDAPKPPSKTAFQTVVSLCKQDKVSTIELLAWAKDTTIVDESVKHLRDIDEAIFRQMIKNWSSVVEEIDVMRSRDGGAA